MVAGDDVTTSKPCSTAISGNFMEFSLPWKPSTPRRLEASSPGPPVSSYFANNQMRGKKLLTGETKMAESFRVTIEIGQEDAKTYDDIFRHYCIFVNFKDPVGEALEHEDVEEPEDLAREYVKEISVDKIYMFIFVDFKHYKV